ncbi:bifunctional glycosyltransferase family 2/GtrA family protein [Pseudonocardia abyssalis]|uniref:dolichyl-phosphate beta-glucosyltransferase n=1 Tax=Pseudonocardia abyssalis TaxID=2792008 RepID=A0ABS6V2J9_9PSEU|nr:bifunctional glycosyltransferase family 2/GtrA family protein [Pseudonocardia abyssalis]MBW0119491.1 bifunctional glycosyltransferase family 2/GtrA family protein [Pseudonocardia abyssalis]MBW0138521.1 bifunctional glycosyltransferase family 2/GtrA family protein [Pseudonocardia abyssalis]
MTVETAPAAPPGARAGGPVLDLVVPVHNEEAALEPSVRRLHAHLSAQLPYPFRITIADNASTDATPRIARRLADELAGVEVFRMAEKGRGRALHAVWESSDAQVLAYCDVDLSTDLAALLPLVAPLISGHSDLAIGTRLGRGSRVVRGAKREFISRSYNLLLRGALAARFSDAQCGFKAIRADVAHALLPHVEDGGWFFDTELLVLAERAGLRIHEVPVDWVDDPDSRVDIVPTALADLRGIARLGRALATGALPLGELRGQLARPSLEVAGVPTGMPGQLVRFAAIGVVSTVAHLLVFLLLRDPLGAYAANLVALLVTAVANTAANRRLTFGVRGRDGAAAQQFQGLIVFGLGLALTTGALALLSAAAPGASAAVELAVLIAANALATLLRFVAFRTWIFRPKESVS